MRMLRVCTNYDHLFVKLFYYVVATDYCVGKNANEHMKACKSGSVSVKQLNDPWMCTEGMRLHGVTCANGCGQIFGDDSAKNHYLLKNKKNGIYVCHYVDNGSCCFALCKLCYLDNLSDNKQSRVRRKRMAPSRPHS